MRRQAKKDLNHSSIASDLQRVGAAVMDLSALGDGRPDALVYFRGNYHLLEIKNGDLPPSQRKLTTDETNFHRLWPGKIHIVSNVKEALKAIGAI